MELDRPEMKALIKLTLTGFCDAQQASRKDEYGFIFRDSVVLILSTIIIMGHMDKNQMPN